MKAPRNLKSPGFTLVELLVVIVIIAAVAALSLTMLPRMMARAKANQSLQNMRQFSPLITTYAGDHSMKLPAARGPVEQPDGITVDLQWHEVCLAILYPDIAAAEFKTKKWWDSTKCIFRNPLFKETALPRGWAPLNPGYGMNEMIAENLASVNTDPAAPAADPLTVSIALASIPDPGRTPLIAPSDNWHYRYDPNEIAGIATHTLKDLLVEGKVPVLFVDGHIEVVTPGEYVTRQLYLVPLAPAT